MEVFRLVSCSNCRRTLTNEEFMCERNAILLWKMDGVVGLKEDLNFSEEDFDQFCAYRSIYCDGCRNVVGKQYLTKNDFLIKFNICAAFSKAHIAINEYKMDGLKFNCLAEKEKTVEGGGRKTDSSWKKKRKEKEFHSGKKISFDLKNRENIKDENFLTIWEAKIKSKLMAKEQELHQINRLYRKLEEKTRVLKNLCSVFNKG